MNGWPWSIKDHWWLGEFKPEEWSICVEDSDEELAHDYRLEPGKHKRVYICRSVAGVALRSPNRRPKLD